MNALKNVPLFKKPTAGLPQNAPPAPSHFSYQGVPTNILTFQTISDMLSHVQLNSEFAIGESKYSELPSNDPARTQVKICSALASVAVMNAEVVSAVATITRNRSEVIEPLKDKHFYTVFGISKNPERNDPNPPLQITFQNVRELCPELTRKEKELSDEEIITYTEQSWMRPSLARHLYILPRLLVMDREKHMTKEMDHITHILCYVAGTCYPKMLRRFRNTTVSVPYLRSLTDIKEFKFKDEVTVQETKEGTENEKIFLTHFVFQCGRQIKHIDISHIIKQADLAEADKPFQLYTEETCKQFHSLLIDIFQALQAALGVLEAEQSSTDGEPSLNFRTAQLAVALNGYALLKLSESNALRRHLKMIQPLLSDKLKEHKVETVLIQSEEMDDEMREVQPHIFKEGSLVELFMSFWDWVRLQVVHFNAIEILLAYVHGRRFPNTPLLIKLLSVPPILDTITRPVTNLPPQVSSQMLPWRDLFNDDSVFPMNCEEHIALYNFLDETAGTAEVIARLVKLWKEHKAPYGKKRQLVVGPDMRVDSTKNIITYMIETLTDDKLKIDCLPGKDERKCAIQDLLHLTQNFDKVDIWKEYGQGTIKGKAITMSLEALQSDMLFFTCLVAPAFKGTLHCEALLASFMTKEFQDPELQTIWDQMQGFAPNFGVSKYCCPVCAKLIEMLCPDSTSKGAHNTMSTCTLPPWLAAAKVDAMNKFFAERLKKELARIMANPNHG